jgi:Tfp pilus assembly protein PilO
MEVEPVTTIEHLAWIIPSGAFLSIVGFVFANNKHNDKRVNRVYERIDEVKKTNDEKYQSKEICAVHLGQIKNDLGEVKTDVKTLLTEVRNSNHKKRRR